MTRKQTHARPRAGKRTRKRLIFFAAEGHNKTEVNYLRDLAKHIGNIKLIRSRDASTDPIRMVKGLVSTMEDTDYDPSLGDLAFCIFDMDCNREKEKQILEARRIAQNHGIQLVASNPCFELWYICHYTGTPKQYASSKEVLEDMDRFIPGYDKAMDGVFEIVGKKINTAIRNAENLEKKAIEKGYQSYTADFSPTTEMYKLVKQIIESGAKSKGPR